MTYNLNGNMTSDGVNTYSWTFGNRMSGASGSFGTATYAYDADNRRTRKTVNGTVTRYLWSGADELGDYNASGGLIRRFVPTGTGTMDDRLAAVDAAGTVRWFHTDHQGSVIAMSLNNGQTIGTANYSPYGEFGDGISGPPAGSYFGYTGRLWDPETGLYQYRARYYSRRLGVFLSTDPIGTKDDPNLYLYVGLDPVNATDPTGEEAACMYGQSQCGARAITAEDQRVQRGIVRFLGNLAEAGSMLVPVEGATIRAANAAFRAVQSPLARAVAARVGVEFGTRFQRVVNEMDRVQNIIRNNARRDDFLGVMRENRGQSTGFDHITEMRNSVRGLENATARLDEAIARGTMNTEQTAAAQASRDAAQQTLREMRRVLQ